MPPRPGYSPLPGAAPGGPGGGGPSSSAAPQNGGGGADMTSSSFPPPSSRLLLDASIPVSHGHHYGGVGGGGGRSGAIPLVMGGRAGLRRPPVAAGARPVTRALAPGQVRRERAGNWQRRRRPPRPPTSKIKKLIFPLFSPSFQPGVLQRKEGRFVSLPENLDLEGLEDDDTAAAAALLTPGDSGLALEGAPSLEPAALPPITPEARGRITIHCLAESLDTAILAARLEARGPAFLGRRYPEVYAGHYVDPITGTRVGELHCFDYGVVVLWSLNRAQEADVLANLVGPALEDPLPPGETEVDEFAYVYGPGKPSIADDTISLPARAVGDATTKLAISHALAQSTKLCLYEERVLEVVEATRDLPEAMAATGRVPVSRTDVARLIGRVFLLKSAVNLLGSVLDVPDFFWDRPDSVQALYQRVCAYVELPARMEVLESRFGVLNSMLDLARAYQDSRHSSRLEWTVILLIVVEIVMGLASILLGGGKMP